MREICFYSSQKFTEKMHYIMVAGQRPLIGRLETERRRRKKKKKKVGGGGCCCSV